MGLLVLSGKGGKGLPLEVFRALEALARLIVLELHRFIEFLLD